MESTVQPVFVKLGGRFDKKLDFHTFHLYWQTGIELLLCYVWPETQKCKAKCVTCE